MILQPDHDKEKEHYMKSSINFYLQHLSLKELKILENNAKELANNYSESYKKWKYKM